MTSPKKICRLCLVQISKDFEVINTCKEGMLKIISLDLNVNLTNNPVICPKCEEILQQTFFFKTTCLGNDDYLKTFRHCDTSIKLNLEEIVQRNFMPDGIKCEDESACRFCFRFFDSTSVVKLGNVEDDIFLGNMLSKCLPEIKLEITHKPIMCLECMENLQKQFNFVVSCLDNDEKIKGYIRLRGTNNNNRVDLNDVLKFVSETRDREESMENNLEIVKLEDMSDDSVVNCDVERLIEECEVVIEDESNIVIEENQVSDDDSDRFEDFLRSTTNIHLPKNTYTCPICSHETNRRDSLELHLLVHKNLPKQELYSCDQCAFTTKWKSSLNQHIIKHREPNDIVKYKCAHCSYESKYKKHLRRHSKKHLKVNPKALKCQYCPFTCRDSWYFKLHNKNKHNIVVTHATDKFSCEICEFETKYKLELDKHKESVHNLFKYTCECGYGTSRLSHFKDHKLRHVDSEEVEMFSCKVCDFKSKYKNSLRHHMVTHESEKIPEKKRKKSRKSKKEKLTENQR